MKKFNTIVLILLAFNVLMKAQETYRWDNVAIGGGGYVTGIVIHPTESGLMYIRTDIGGIFRWDEKNKRWISLSGWIKPGENNLFGVDGIALDKNNPNVIYAALGKYPTEAGGIYKSSDKGKSWIKLRDVLFAGNLDYRWVGENIAVDPNNSNIVYCGTRTEGLLRSTNAGSSWSKVTSVPNGNVGNPTNYWDNHPIGIRNVVIDGSQTLSGKSKNIYVAVFQTGIYCSTDAGASFSLMSGSPKKVHRIALAPGNVLYVTTDDGIYKYDGSWRKLPVNPSGYTYFNGIDVDPYDSNRLIASTGNMAWWTKQYKSTDGGEHWTEMDAFNGTMTVHDRTWHKGELGFFQAATAAYIFDPHKPGRVFSTDWYQVWRCENIWESNTHWYNDVMGHEEVVPLAILCPHTGVSLFSGHGDVVGFKHSDKTVLPQKRLTNKGECTSIDYCESNPNYMTLVSADDWNGANTQIFVSTNAGDDFVAVNTPSGARNGKIAYASNDVNNIVYVYGNSAPYYSTDRGSSWKLSSGAPPTALNTTYMYQWNDPLKSDRNANNTFYLMDWSSGFLYKSTNGGANWSKTNTTALPVVDGGYIDRCNLSVGFDGKNQYIMVSLGSKGLWLSSNKGASFNKNNYFSTALMSAMGKAKQGTSYPTLYVYGIHDEQWGVYRSIDFGTSWVRINDNKHYMGNSPTYMGADRQTYGTVYIGNNGSGLFYGEIIKQTPYSGTAKTLPGIVEAEDFDNGGQGEAYNDVDASNNGGEYRTSEGVDIQSCSEGGYNVGWIAAGEWLEYTVNVKISGTYTVKARVASLTEGVDLSITFSKGNVSSGKMTTGSTGGWQNWTTISKTGIMLEAGEQIMRITMNKKGFNLNYIELELTSCSGSGSISYLRYDDIGGTTVDNLKYAAKFPANPDYTTTRTLFKAPSNVKDNYGVLMRGYLCPVKDGNYTFWIAGDDNVELNLSTNSSFLYKTRIAYHTGWTNPEEWNKYSTQKSSAISLKAGELYYIEALLKEGSGGDNLAVGWAKPGEGTSVPSEVIPGSMLIPFNSSLKSAVLIENSSISSTKSVPEIFPNPSSGVFTILGLTIGASIEIYSVTGTLVCRKVVSANELAYFNLNMENGLYLVKIRTSNATYSQKLVIKN